MALQAGTVLIFGVDTPTKTYGIVQTASTVGNIKRSTAKAPDGHVISIQEYGDKKELDLTYMPLSTASAEPEIGTPFDFDGLTWQIDNIIGTSVVDGFKSIALNATYYPNIH